MNSTGKTFIASIFLAATLAACGGKPTETAPIAQQPLAVESIRNVDATLWYNTSAERDYIYLQTYKYAEVMVQQNLNSTTNNKPKAVVLDIDETVLDNSPYNLQLIKNGTTYSSDSWEEWVSRKTAKPLPGAREFLLFCEQNGIEIFYISNRSEDSKDATLENITNSGLPLMDPDHVLLKTASSNKDARRNRVTSHYDVLLYLGDNLRDFDERFAERSDNYGRNTVANHAEFFLDRCILLPNPMYGEWQKPLKDFKFSERVQEEPKTEMPEKKDQK